MSVIYKAVFLGYKHNVDYTVGEIHKLSLKNKNKLIEYMFIHKWLNEKKGIYLCIEKHPSNKTYHYYIIRNDSNYPILSKKHNYINYANCLEKGLLHALEECEIKYKIIDFSTRLC